MGESADGVLLERALAYDPRSRGSSDFEVRHSLNGSIIAMLPSPRGGIGGLLLGNWTANSIYFARSAVPTPWAFLCIRCQEAFDRSPEEMQTPPREFIPPKPLEHFA